MGEGDGTWAVVIAGGQGTRLWPWSRPHRPKPCLDVDGRRTLLEATLARLGVPRERVLVVTGPAMAEAIRAVPGLRADQVLVEPSPRGTLPAALWGTEVAAARGAERVGVFPADGWVDDDQALTTTVDRGLALAEDTGRLVLVGLHPTEPSTRYGYLTLGGPLAHGAREVVAFVEKPPRSRAEALVRTGAVWNGGMFLWRVDALREAVARHQPATAEALRAWREGERSLEQAWPAMAATSVDRGLLEPHDHLAAVAGRFGWRDLGTWEAVGALLEEGELGRARCEDGIALQGGDHLVYAPGLRVATLGVSDLVIAVHDGVVMVLPRDRVGEVGRLARAAADRGWDGVRG